MSPPPSDSEDKFLFKDAVDELGADLIGAELWKKYGTWPMYSKFFDYEAPLFHHLHLIDEAAGRVGPHRQARSLLLPAPAQQPPGQVPGHLLRLRPGRDPGHGHASACCSYESGDNRITELSRAYRIELGTGWYTPPGVVHAPGSVLTYEPQWNSDVNSVHENITAGEVYPYEFLVENCPEDQQARPRLHHEPDGLGEERRPALQEALLPPADPGAAGRRLHARNGSPTPTPISAPRS